ncbi:hypothetical protein ZIOFF_053638 [Zingiber officinale]|uniref:Phospholipid-transporting ATPase n=1 Tax=Zingiber officinale TaxID=94328 RepID=A0A8J5FCM2_ZINOF|nr:hypothetical protein ZIOFF_053638 [Zingiber officinale]
MALQGPPTLPQQEARPSVSSSHHHRHRSSRYQFSLDNINFPLPFIRHGSRAESERFAASQRELHDSDSRNVILGDTDGSDPHLEFAGNAVRTAKYSLLTFLPRNLFEQFHRVSYIYFLAIAVLNQLPQLAVFGRGASILPLAFVLVVTAAKDAYEDWRRHRSDRIENNRPVSVHDPCTGQFCSKRWKDVRVGDVLKVSDDETIPCDMVILSTSDPSGLCYVQTINLDGESNLKTRYAKQETMSRLASDKCVIRCEEPNRNIYGFLANMEVDGKRVSLGPSNIILRGCELKNTAWVMGVAVYTGNETKVMLNSSDAPSKRSRLETQMNRETLLLSAILIALCSVVSICSGIWLGKHGDGLELAQFFRKRDYSGDVDRNYNYYGIGIQVFFTFLMSAIVFQIMIPISLYISMEMVRLGQSYFMTWDSNLLDESSKSWFQCRALNINEDLGQIKYVFSDKTGTLTENKMEFRRTSIWGIDYSGGNASSQDNNELHYTIWKTKKPVKTDPDLVKLLRNETDTEHGRQAYEFFLALACCNTMIPQVVETSDPNETLIDYQGESPDEQALVNAAASYGFVLMERTSGHIIVDVLGEKQSSKDFEPICSKVIQSVPSSISLLLHATKLLNQSSPIFNSYEYNCRFDVLGLHEFDSDRKRMSVIIRCPDNTVKLFVKGADTSMFGVAQKSLDLKVIDATKINLEAYSCLGLRTLVIGVRKLSRNEFKAWHSAYENASTTLIGRGKLLRAVAVDFERNFEILGASAIEDKLQQGVPEAIESMRKADIRVWVLTGDKQETAISIGYSCKLLTSEMTQIVINSNSRETCKKSLHDAVAMSCNLAEMPTESRLSSSVSSRVPMALIVDGSSLVYMLETELQEELFKVAIICDVVLCCRVAPLQKAGIIALIKDRIDDLTLAIGDGANDVSMIQMADVGIGISGQEGRQAVMASDFAMGQFRFLAPLLLVHGHWNYQRMTYMILYNFYRNAVFVFILFWYVLYAAYSLTTAVTEWSSVLYSIIYTALPTIIIGIFDKDLSRETLIKYPQLYRSGQMNKSYNLKLFNITMLDTVWQSVVIFFIPCVAYTHSGIDESSLGDLWTLAVVVLVNIHLAMDVFRWNWITHASIWGCIAATIICEIVIDSVWFLPGYWAVFNVMRTGLFWLCLLGVLVAGMLPRFVMKALIQHFMPNDIQIARELEKFRNVNGDSTSRRRLSQP